MARKRRAPGGPLAGRACAAAAQRCQRTAQPPSASAAEQLRRAARELQARPQLQERPSHGLAWRGSRAREGRGPTAAARARQVVEELVSNVGVVEKLTSFQHKDANGRDWGLNVRQRAKELAGLVTDGDRIRAERQKARARLLLGVHKG
jgi:hypothetical protein